MLGIRGSPAYESLNHDAMLSSKLLSKSVRNLDTIDSIISPERSIPATANGAPTIAKAGLDVGAILFHLNQSHRVSHFTDFL